jgi:hypothetical protein
MHHAQLNAVVVPSIGVVPGTARWAHPMLICQVW